VFALLTAAYSTMTPHRVWGAIAAPGYAVALLATLVAVLTTRDTSVTPPDRREPGGAARLGIAVFAIAVTVVLPLVVQAAQRATGRPGRAQDEVSVIEAAGRRLLEYGTPYLDRHTIEGLPDALRLLAYTPYQPAMALLGTPRALRPAAWWTDARIVFLLVSAAAIACALLTLRLPATRRSAVRAIQAVSVLPICALTLATGGDDLPVLALCLLALALCAGGHPLAGGIVIGVAGSLKLIALPIAVVLAAYLLTRGRKEAVRYAAGAFGLPLLTLIPAALLNADSVVENVLRFPLGHGIVTSPAASPLPGHLLATAAPWGRAVVIALLAATMIGFGIGLIRRPPRTVAAATTVGAIGLLIAIALLPATRFGYLMYPIALLAWVPALRTGAVDA